MYASVWFVFRREETLVFMSIKNLTLYVRRKEQ